MLDSDQMAQNMAEILKAHGMKIQIGGCGCCQSPWVRFEYKGEPVVAAGDDAAYEFCIDMFADPIEDQAI